MHTESTSKSADKFETIKRLEESIAHTAHLLPAQGPINVFVHHNTLHAFEDLHFHDAVAVAAETFGCHPYLLEEEFRRELAGNRMTEADVEEALQKTTIQPDLSLADGLITRFQLRRAMMLYPLYFAPPAELNWLIAETDALQKFRKDQQSQHRSEMVETTKRWILRDLLNSTSKDTSGAEQRDKHPQNHDNNSKSNGHRELIEQTLADVCDDSPVDWTEQDWESATLRLIWSACRTGTETIPQKIQGSEGIRHRDILYRATGIDSDKMVTELLVRFSSVYVDQGFSQWELPERSTGFFHCFLQLYSQSGVSPGMPYDGLTKELNYLKQKGTTALESVLDSLRDMGVTETEWDEFLAETLLALRGWAGILNQIEHRGDRVPLGVPSHSLQEFLAVKLIVERVVLQNLIRRELKNAYNLQDLRQRLTPPQQSNGLGEASLQRAFTLYQLAQSCGWAPETLHQLSSDQWTELLTEVESFDSLQRRKIFQLAFESAYRQQVLSSYQLHSQKVGLRQVDRTAQPKTRPSFQIVCCIDDREESFRRHLEEIDPACETFGAAGFFAVPIYYRGAGDAHFVPLCPIIMKPQHYIVEQVREEALEKHGRRTRARKLIGKQAHAWHTSSRSFISGLGMALLGPLATIPLVARVLFPRLTAAFRRAAGNILTPPTETELTLERMEGSPGKEPNQLGFTVSEMADAVQRLLQDIGLTKLFAPIIVVCGHGSSSLNNPHESAYNCGACGGGRGGPNARAVAAMANDSRVRELLKSRGLIIPEDCCFVGAFHNTCDDSIRFVEIEKIPSSLKAYFDHVLKTIEQARTRNAHERSRRFVSAGLSLKPAAALRHVETRSEDLSQTRPEYNHATNAICTVARRGRTRGLYLDRRSFLVSYDPTQDDMEQSILARILGAVIPVCAGINLEYYFSRVDVTGYGCGSKLPHNVTSLIGVMDGAASDLRTGLSAQMVEIHDPVRLLFVIETRPENFLSIMARNPVIKRLCGNGWVQVATLSPDSADIHLLDGDRFEQFHGKITDLPRVRNSIEWYRGWRDNLGFAQVTAGLAPGIAIQ
jgi:uncharacterized protein YbcC (UPF0753/DUF2309 family)